MLSLYCIFQNTNPTHYSQKKCINECACTSGYSTSSTIFQILNIASNCQSRTEKIKCFLEGLDLSLYTH